MSGNSQIICLVARAYYLKRMVQIFREFLENLPDGLGIEKQVDGVIYSGEWSDGRRHVMGTVDFGNGTSYGRISKRSCL